MSSMMRAWVAGIWKEGSSEASRSSSLGAEKEAEQSLEFTSPSGSEFPLCPAGVYILELPVPAT